jgi:hypothetical protein
MLPLPSEFPSDAVSAIITGVKNGDYKSNATVTAGWNLLGFGLNIGFGKLVAGGSGTGQHIETLADADDLSDEQAIGLLEAMENGKVAGADPAGSFDKATLLAVLKWVAKVILQIAPLVI